MISLDLILKYSPLIILLIAIIIDLIFSELPNSLHPVVLMGNYLSYFWKRRIGKSKSSLFIWGLLIIISGIIIFGSVYFIKFLPEYISIIITIVILPNMFSIRRLFQVSKIIEKELISGNLVEARKLTSYHLVSRDTSQLSEDEISCCVIESITENMTDSITSPVFYYLIFGLPGAVICRFINTADAMIGYRYGDFEYGGKIAARFDDFIHLIPSRISLIFLTISSILFKKNPLKALKGAIKGCKQTSSPNAGVTIGAAAYLFGLNLKKEGCYNLNGNGRKCKVNDIKKIRIWVSVSVFFQLIIFLMLFFLILHRGLISG